MFTATRDSRLEDDPFRSVRSGAEGVPAVPELGSAAGRGGRAEGGRR
ncbi:hypothetical protein [Natronococcus jeotgali]|nr:hypothetical protein [Natronococcus jeotgali]